MGTEIGGNREYGNMALPSQLPNYQKSRLPGNILPDCWGLLIVDSGHVRWPILVLMVLGKKMMQESKCP